MLTGAGVRRIDFAGIMVVRVVLMGKLLMGKR